MIAKTLSPAKLNLFLETPRRRKDGFHEIDTLMAAVDVCDEVQIELTSDTTWQLDCRWASTTGSSKNERQFHKPLTAAPSGDLPTGSDNLAIAAATAFVENFAESASGWDGGHITIRKQIPAGAGMGGASSNAASVLRCLAELHQRQTGQQVSRERLAAVAAELGSDVPFFLFQTGTLAHASGRGEILKTISTERTFYGVVLHPGVGLSTAQVYGNNAIIPPVASSAGLREWLTVEPPVNVPSEWLHEHLGHNRLQSSAAALLPAVPEMLAFLRETVDSADLSDAGVITAMTGSGSACYVITPDQSAAGRVTQVLQTALPGHPNLGSAWAAPFRTLARPPEIDIG